MPAFAAYFVSLQRQKQREKASNFRFCQFAAQKQRDFLFVSPESRGVVVTVQRCCQRFRPFDSVLQRRGVGDSVEELENSVEELEGLDLHLDAGRCSANQRILSFFSSYRLFIRACQRIFSHFLSNFSIFQRESA